MAKLTRTQKYAELRETLANDPEPSLTTKELSNYEDRLNNIANQLSGNDVHTNSKPIEEVTPIEQLVQTFKEEEKVSEVKAPVQPQPVQQPYTAPVQPVSAPAAKPEDVIDKAADELNTMITQEIQMFNQQNNVQPTPVAPVQPTPVAPVYSEPYTNIEVSPIGPAQEPEVPQKPIAEFENERPEFMGLYVNPDVEKAYLESEQRIAQQQQQMSSSFEQQIHTGIVDQNMLNTAPQEPKPVQEPVKPTIMQEPADNHVIDHSNDVQNTFINEVMNEVDQHIKQNGQQTITQLTNDMVNEVRRAENVAPVQPRPVQQQYVQQPQYIEQPVQPRPVQPQPVQQPYVAPVQPSVSQPQPVSDEQYSNTVSMEISKIMNDVVTPAPEVKPAVQQPKAEEHPVLTKKLEEEKTEEVVEIKNINDTDLNVAPAKEATTGTIPFIVAANDDELIEEEEEEGSNTVLNVILIILIVILVAVLGLIIFYILKTKGII